MPICFPAAISATKMEDYQVPPNSAIVKKAHEMRMAVDFIMIWICVKSACLLFQSHSMGKEMDKFPW
jgi:hypothetical protein